MYPPLYHKILKQIQQHKLQSLTVNIFDTIILNEYWPSDLRLYDLTIKQLPLLQTAISTDLTAYEVFSLRLYAKKLTLLDQPTLRLDLWLDKLIDLLSLKYHKILTDDQNLDLLANLIKVELEFTINNCRPNLPLLAQLHQLKQAFPDLKIYFLTNTYIPSAQIKALLEIFQIDIFDNGASGADLGTNYPTLFSQLPNNFDPERNLHLGDSRQRDIITLRSQGCKTIHYRPLRMRGLRTLIGATWLHILNSRAIFTARHNAPADPLVTLGQVLTLKDLAYREINQHLSLNPNIYFCADNITNLSVNHSSTVNGDLTHIHTIPGLNSLNLFPAFVWLLANFSSPRWNAPELLKLLMQQEGITSRSTLYHLCFSPDYVYSQLAIDSFTEAEFYQVFLDEVRNADPHYTTLPRNSYETLVNNFPPADHPIVFATVFNDNNIDLFREFARLHGIDYDLTELLLNPSNIFIQGENFANDFARSFYERSQIELGRRLAITDIANTNLSPDLYLRKILKPQLTKLLRKLS